MKSHLFFRKDTFIYGRVGARVSKAFFSPVVEIQKGLGASEWEQ